MIEFTILGEPVPWGRVVPIVFRVGHQCRVKMVTPEDTRAAEAAFAKEAALYRPRKPINGPIRMNTVFVVTPPRSFPADRSRDWPTVPPDEDNYRKLVLDSLKAVFFHNDAQVCGGENYKIYGSPARTFVQIFRLGPADVARVRGLIGEQASAQPELFGATS